MEKKQFVFGNKVLRKIFGPICGAGEWKRRRHNEEIRTTQYGDHVIVAVIKSRRLKWAGHVIRRSEDSNMKTETLGSRPVGRPKNRWKDQVLKDLQKLNLTEEDADNRDSWRLKIDEDIN
uniref:Uncharacterized protein n=1 Tax=Cacopsylla melanoneura TaxID=428564 RepID=A0A8D8YTS7_9HEMI